MTTDPPDLTTGALAGPRRWTGFDAGSVRAHADADPRSRGSVRSRCSTGARGRVALSVAPGGDPARGRGAPGDRRGAGSVADVLRAGPGPDPAHHGLAPPRGQEAGVRLPRRDHQRTRLTHAVEVAQVAIEHRAGRAGCVPLDRGDRAGSRLRARAVRARARGGVHALPARRLRPRRSTARMSSSRP